MKIRLFLWLILLCISSSFAQSSFTIDLSLPPIKIDFDQLLQIIEDSNHIISKYDSLYSYREENLIIINKSTRQSTSNLLDSKNIHFKSAKYINYQYSNYRGSIKKIELDLRDSERTISITGNNYLEIKTISDLYKKELAEYRNYFGGLTFRNLLSIITSTISLIILIITVRITSSKKEGIVIHILSNIRFIFGIILFIISQLFIWGIIDLYNLFPGFIIYKNNIGFIDKYANLFTFIAFILAILSITGVDILKRKSQ
jgi:hypothetical protein